MALPWEHRREADLKSADVEAVRRVSQSGRISLPVSCLISHFVISADAPHDSQLIMQWESKSDHGYDGT